MDFLKDYLAEEFPGETIACYSGRGGKVRDRAGFWSECTKEQIKQRLKARAIKFLVCTDAASEGLNFQFCGMLVNYDLPWNPMKVEQRIGRIDRIGQKYAKIRVVNLAYQDTVEADVYFALASGSTSSRAWWAASSRSCRDCPSSSRRSPCRRKRTARQPGIVSWPIWNRRPARPNRAIPRHRRGRDRRPGVARAAPPSALTLSELDLALNHPGILPPGCRMAAAGRRLLRAASPRYG